MDTRFLYLCKSILLCILTILCALGILLFPADVSKGALNGMNYCLYTLIPSLFPFMVLSSFIVNSRASYLLAKILHPITQFFFYLPGSAGAVIVMSMVGGYPIGARGCMSLLNQRVITQKQAQRMLCFCVNAGPAFIITVVGSVLFQNTLLGVLIFFSQIVAMLIIGITLGLTARLRQENFINATAAPACCDSPFVESTLDASRSLFNMCAFVILFSSLLSLLRSIGIAQGICRLLLQLQIPASISASLLSILTEITSGCVDTAVLHAPITLLTFGLGFGGFCVHFQIFSIIKSGMSKLKFVLFRLFHGIVAALIFTVFLPLLPDSPVSVFSNTNQTISGTLSYSIPAGIALAVCCIIFLFSVSFERNNPFVKR